MKSNNLLNTELKLRTEWLNCLSTIIGRAATAGIAFKGAVSRPLSDTDVTTDTTPKTRTRRGTKVNASYASKDKETVLKYRARGWTYQRIANKTGVPMPTIGVWIRKELENGTAAKTSKLVQRNKKAKRRAA